MCVFVFVCVGVLKGMCVCVLGRILNSHRDKNERREEGKQEI